MVPPATASALGDFLAGLWVPGPRWRARGFATARLVIVPGRLLVTPRFRHELVNFVLGIPSSVEYAWPAVVLERLRPTGQIQILIEVNGGLGAVAVGRLSRARLPQALRAAGFTVVERTRWGWEAPRPVSPADLDGYADQVPTCVSTT